METKSHDRSGTISFLLLISGQLVVLAVLIQHRSGNNAVLGRYSPAFAGLILAFLVFLAATLTVGLRLRRGSRVPKRFLERISGLPGLAELATGCGLVLLVQTILFAEIVEIYVPPPWLILGLALVYSGIVCLTVGSMDGRRKRVFPGKLGLLLFGFGCAFGLGELGLRYYARFTHYRMLPANLHWEFHPAPEHLPGIHGVSHYTTNEEGIRGDPFQAVDRTNILAIGGSTTECVYLDNGEAWPMLLQEKVNRRGYRPPLWVGNVGRSGHGLVEHIHALRYFAPQYRLDAVVMLVGVNDLMPVLWKPEIYDPHEEDPEDFERFLDHSFYRRPLVDPDIARDFPKNLAYWNLVYRFYTRREHPLVGILVEDQAGKNYAPRRRIYRQAKRVIDRLPDLGPALTRYERNLDTIVRAAKTQRLRLIFATQPTMWRESLTPEAESLLWFGLYGDTANPLGRYTVTALARAMEMFNDKLREVCQANQVEFVDLAAVMNGEEAYFYDDVHFNELGSRTVADHFLEYLFPASK